MKNVQEAAKNVDTVLSTRLLGTIERTRGLVFRAKLLFQQQDWKACMACAQRVAASGHLVTLRAEALMLASECADRLGERSVGRDLAAQSAKVCCLFLIESLRCRRRRPERQGVPRPVHPFASQPWSNHPFVKQACCRTNALGARVAEQTLVAEPTLVAEQTLWSSRAAPGASRACGRLCAPALPCVCKKCLPWPGPMDSLFISTQRLHCR